MVASSSDLGEPWKFSNVTDNLIQLGLELPWDGGPGTGLQLGSGRLIIPGCDSKGAHPIFSDDGGKTYQALHRIALVA